MKKITFFLLLFPLLLANQLQASHFMGSEMWYECLGGCNYRIYQTNYYNCSGAATGGGGTLSSTPPSNLTVTGVGGVAPAMSGAWVLYYLCEVAPICPTQPTNCTIPGAAMNGIISATYYQDYNLCNSGCSSVTLGWGTCCRSYAISSGAGSNGIYNEITIDLTNNLGNSSPYFYTNPSNYITSGQFATFSQGAFDPDGDSLVYSLDTCWSSATQAITYNAGYSPTSPLGSSWGVTIDATTGQLSFTPQAGNIVTGIVGIKVSEYRNGILIGSILRDMQVTVLSGAATTNTPPTYTLSNITGAVPMSNNTLVTNASIPCSFDIVATDNAAQLLSLSHHITSVFPNATVTFIPNTNPLLINVSFTPTQAQVGPLLPIPIDIFDDVCTINAHTMFFTAIKVNPFSVNTNITPAACGLASGAIALTPTGGTPPYSYAWSTGDTTPNIANLLPGQYDFQVTDSNNLVYNSGPIYLTAGNLATTLALNSPDCNATNGSITPTTTNGLPPYSYTWNTGIVADSLTGIGIGGYSVNITDAAGCFEHKATMLDYDVADSCFSRISGRYYYDANNNCVQDVGEVGMANTWIDLTPGGAMLTNVNGDYSFIVPNTGNYTVEVYPSITSATPSTCQPSSTYNVYMPALGIDSTGFDFPYNLNPDISVALSEGNYGLANVWHHAMIYCHNISYYLSNATVTYQHSPIFQNLTFSIPPTTYNLATHTATWQLTNFTIGSNTYISIYGNTDPTATLGDTVTSFVSILPTIGDVNPQNNQDTAVRVVVSSYDPNYKEVYPQGETNYGLIPPTTTSLDYTIHFQNTGNYPAEYVIIRDTIDEDLDISSINVEMTSHNCTVTAEDDKVLVFTFAHIQLPDSTTDEPNSHGFVRYKINLKPNLPLDTHIDNTAYIYFDFNAPVITNTTHSTLYEKMEIAMNPNFVFCPGDVINIDVQKGKMPYNFVWSNGTSNLNSMNGSLTIPANFANGVQSVVVSDFYGATKTIYFTVTNQAIANANFSFTSAGNLFFFNANDLGLTTYAWDFGNGQTSNLPTNNITFASAGSYQVSLIVSDNCGGKDTMTQTIVVTTDISDAAFAQSLTLFPNPTHNISTFRFYNPDNSPYQLTISDLSGKILQTIPDIRSEKVEVNHTNVAKGAYLWELKGKFTARGMLWVE